MSRQPSAAATPPAAPRRDGLVAAALGLALRLLVVAWAWSRIPPAADGTFYDTIGRRIADGEGYTWLWPDGAVTYAAHYPVGYPALVALAYKVITRAPGAAMLLGALLGSVSVYAVHRLVARGGSRKQAMVAAVIVAVHPGLVSYTPALMTEGITASLVAVAAALFAYTGEATGWRRLRRAAVLGVVLGAATYVRPQSLLLAPALACMLAPALRDGGLAARARAFVGPALVAGAAALAVVAPWTARNCVRMQRCALVSYNGGWNLLIGTDVTARGSWAEVKVPPACRTVFDEAEKDACYGAEAARTIAHDPVPWIALVPAKLAATFDYAGAGPWYLHAANPEAFSERAKVVLGALELAFERLVLFAALVATSRRLRGAPSRVARAIGVVTLASAISLLTVHGYFAVLGLVLGLGALVLGKARHELPPTFAAAFVVVGSTAAVHAVFFGTGRYALVTFPVVAALAVFALGQSPSEGAKTG